jgi:hypothetical protein
MKPHKHAELIKAWADGAEIQYKTIDSNDWRSIFWGWNWDNTMILEYRIKPEPKPDVVRYLKKSPLHGWNETNHIAGTCVEYTIIRLVYDGETGELKSAEVLK